MYNRSNNTVQMPAGCRIVTSAVLFTARTAGSQGRQHSAAMAALSPTTHVKGSNPEQYCQAYVHGLPSFNCSTTPRPQAGCNMIAILTTPQTALAAAWWITYKYPVKCPVQHTILANAVHFSMPQSLNPGI
jgi:hypothetical protein